MTDTMLCITFTGIVLSVLLLFFLFLDSFVNQRTVQQNREVKTRLNKVVAERLDKLNQQTEIQSVSLHARISILQQFIAEVKRH